MKEAYITVTGTLYRYGTEMVEKGDILYLKKDTNNEYDTESIQVNHTLLVKSDMSQTAFKL